MPISNSASGANIGDIKPSGAPNVPAGWLECGGQAVSRAAYAALFDEVGTLYGVGDGSTTFNLPDLRGRSLFGRDDLGGTAANRLTTAAGGVDGVTLGAVGGGQEVTLISADLASHSHTTTYGINSGGSNFGANGIGSYNLTPAVRTSSSSGSNSPHANIPPAAVVNYIIKT